MKKIKIDKKAIIVANGKKPSKKVFNQLLKQGYSTIVAADGGANSLHEMGITPNFIIGDFDSLSSSTLKKIKPGVTELIKISRQSDTDVEKSIKYLIKKKFTHIMLLGVDGNRFDHLLGNLSLGLKYLDKIIINIIVGDSALSFLGSSENISTKKGEIVSVFGFSERGNLTSDGLKYSLEVLNLTFGNQDSISNIATKSEIKLKIDSGKFILVRSIKTFFHK
ncbi:MAG: thiamine diphosphokinase [Ignavibacteria bacterium]|nr:thiamine diphosphokinase [Ignavibacteria bacterium]